MVLCILHHIYGIGCRSIVPLVYLSVVSNAKSIHESLLLIVHLPQSLLKIPTPIFSLPLVYLRPLSSPTTTCGSCH
ncbi:hypothetical protein EUGRSUZ_D01547 [Eucalyptus grandis]|uniref:Uncharacterized protein n=2 Tax=Eucalyptus grandis TaxID=71139 RepID=A0ACC3L5Q0_EUCGR|nr:hypothetical protein EUGRSUZ_D01547 [Eucalyptus grandis]